MARSPRRPDYDQGLSYARFGEPHVAGLWPRPDPPRTLEPGGARARPGARGPRNYRRSDERVLDDVWVRLARDPELDASDIEVEVKDGEVTLSGTVPDRWTKRRAEDLADDVLGVEEVHNLLRLSRRGERVPRGPRAPAPMRFGGADFGADYSADVAP